jgi:hypothetical protein
MMLGGSLTETLHQRSSGNSLHAVSRVEDVQVALQQPKYPREFSDSSRLQGGSWAH